MICWFVDLAILGFVDYRLICHEAEPFYAVGHFVHCAFHDSLGGVVGVGGDGVEQPQLKHETFHEINVAGVAGDHSGVGVLLELADFVLLHPQRAARAKMHIAVEENVWMLAAEGADVDVDAVGEHYLLLLAVEAQVYHVVGGVRVVVEAVDVTLEVLRRRHLPENVRNFYRIFQKFQ